MPKRQKRACSILLLRFFFALFFSLHFFSFRSLGSSSFMIKVCFFLLVFSFVLYILFLLTYFIFFFVLSFHFPFSPLSFYFIFDLQDLFTILFLIKVCFSFFFWFFL